MEVMIDLETMDNQPSAVVLSIGLVAFDWASRTGAAADKPDGLVGEPMTFVLDAELQQRHGRTIGAKTVEWWLRQGGVAQEAAFGNTNRRAVTGALRDIESWLEVLRPDGVWGNGADFDCVILQSLYRSFGMECPFKHWQHRCYRTLRSVVPGYTGDERSTHIAGEDALRQARHAIELMRVLKGGGA